MHDLNPLSNRRFPSGAGEISRIGWEFFRADRRHMLRKALLVGGILSSVLYVAMPREFLDCRIRRTVVE